MLTEHQLNMVETIVSDIIVMKDRFKDEETAESQYVLVEPQPFPNFFAEPVVVNVAFEPLGTVQLIPHQTSTSLELVDKPDLVVPSFKKSSSSNMKIRTYAQAIQVLQYSVSVNLSDIVCSPYFVNFKGTIKVIARVLKT